MEKVLNLLDQCLNKSLNQIIISNKRKTDTTKKVVVRPFMEKDKILFQFSKYTDKQVFHENLEKEEAIKRIDEFLTTLFKQMDIYVEGKQYNILVSKKGKSNIKSKNNNTIKKIELTHNRKKKYLLPEDEAIPFLVELGVSTKEGKIVDKMNKKFRQINRFLEFIRDILPELNKNKKLTIIDFGCGKSYLTFAMYHYLKVMNRYDVNMIGLDLKKDVINNCNNLAQKFGYEDLHFYEGDISSYEGVDSVDMVVTLHACDVATDYALDKAVNWGAKVILSVPCCQHELNNQIESELLEPILKYGLLKERMSAILTDGFRANILEQCGYDVQILEFIDMEHTPKNLLIRAIKSKSKPDVNNKYIELKTSVNGRLTLDKLLMKKNQN